MQIRGVKKYLDGGQESVYCDIMHRDNSSLALRYLHTEDPYAAAVEVVEMYFWENRDYVLYKLFTIHGTPRGYRFEVCRDLKLADDRAERMDLGLSLTVDPIGDLHIEGEEIVVEYEGRGLLEASDKEIIQRARESIAENYRVVLREAEDLRSRSRGR